MDNNHLLWIDPILETERIVNFIHDIILKKMKRYGAVVGISGGIDSSVILALCVRALGSDHVLAVVMPEHESNPATQGIATMLAKNYQVSYVYENITPVLTAFRCYKRRDLAIKALFPEYDSENGYKCKITLPNNLLDSDILNFFTLTIYDPNHKEKSIRLPLREYLKIVAATNMKQRTRMVFLYYYAELNNYSVAGTTNKNEYDLGFFVKYGDGGVDLEPIAHLYKTQVFQLAEYLEVPDIIRKRSPTTDTYSAGSTQQEFFYRLPFALLDLLWFAQENSISVKDAASLTGLSEIQVQRVWEDILRKKRTTDYIRMNPLGLIS